jgi:serine/threonine protein kinase
VTLATSRIVEQGETPYAHEREAIDFVINALPNSDPYHVWSLLELLDPSSGRLYEIDLLVLGYAALYVVEIKSGPGRYEGDTLDWVRKAPEDSMPRVVENPYRLTNLKAKVLASRLRTRLKDPAHLPWIEPLVFLSAPNVELRFRNFGDHGVVTRETLKRAVQFHEFPGVDAARARKPITVPAMRDIAAALKDIGLRARKSHLFVGSYELGDLLVDGAGYQDRVATHRDQKFIQRRARTWTVPRQTTVERRQQLRRAADREAQLLWDVREHANILRFAEYVTDAELGPTVFFDAFDGLPLDAFMRHEKTLSFFERVEIVEQIGRALAFCHRKGVVHGGLSPDAVLVRRAPGTGAVDVRLFNFQLGTGADVEATAHWSALAAEPWALYQAPELRENPAQRSPVSDMFSLGALASLILTGRAPGASAVEIDQRLARHRCLDPRGADDGLPESVAVLLEQATQLSPLQRADDVESWIEQLMGEVTRPAAPTKTAAPALDPLQARPGDALGDELLVEATDDGRPLLGQGATSRVLLVRRVVDDRLHALKVSLGPEHDERLGHEAAVLAGLRHARIVQLVDQRIYAERPSLLMSLAGTETLHRYLQREGSVSLDRAARYGDDLLSALDHLEEHQILHRDLKPANLGVGSVGKKADHLTLFDFSLTTAPLTELNVGTAAYRDPYLRLRGTWDYAAERWSAAVTLHEMLTGTRPGFVDAAVPARVGGSPLDVDARVQVAVERFDPSVRDRLAAFFDRALARDIENRFTSSDEMRRAWIAAFLPSTATTMATTTATKAAASAAPPSAAASVAEPLGGVGVVDDDAPSPTLSRDQLAAIPADTALDALPLSPRAKNALDRAGVLVARDLLGLADNRLSAIRGIGRRVAEEILAFRDAWKAAQTETVVETRAFFPNYRGEDLRLDGTRLAPAAVRAFDDAGLHSLAALATAPASQVQALASRHGFELAPVQSVLSDENADANARERPSTIEGWVDGLLPRRKKGARHARELYGLEGPFRGRLSVTVRELADRLELTTAAMYIAFGKLRDDQQKHPAIDELQRHVRVVVDQAGGTLPLDKAARALMAQIPFDRSAAVDDVVVQAAALVRLVADLEKDDDDGLRTLRVRDALWLCRSDGHGRGTKALGEAADALAARDALAGPGEVARVLGDAVRDTPLAALPVERLADIAAAASERAARSARLELYPRAMSPERALALSSSQLKSGLSAAQIVSRVQLRYPDAAPLPERPALDVLLQPHGLVFDEQSGVYTRPGVGEPTAMGTRVSSSLTRVATALPSQPVAMDEAAIEARRFDEQLRNAIERRALRIVGVRADRAAAAALRLGERLGVAPVAFDVLLVRAIRAQMARVKREDVIHAADRQGRTGPAWGNLQSLVKAAADDVARQLLPRRGPLLLVQPGPLARYRLEGFLQQLVQASLDPACDGPTLLLVPSLEPAGLPRINGELPIPGVTPGHALWVPHTWLQNRHHAAALPVGPSAASSTLTSLTTSSSSSSSTARISVVASVSARGPARDPTAR